MVTALKRETVYAVGEVMRNHCGGDNAKLCIAPDLLHSCLFCFKGDGTIGACDCFHDKLVGPVQNRVCKLWEFHTHRIAKVPPQCYPDLMREVRLADRVGEATGHGRELAYTLGVLLHIIEDLPASLKLNLPNIGWMTELMHAAMDERRFEDVIRFFDNLAVNLRKDQPEETAWDKLLYELTAPRQAGGPKEE